jgi:KUP system potassium uptake protein
VITGAFSLTRQAIQLGFCRAWRSAHLRAHLGQIYIPRLNWLLLVVVLILVWALRTSSNLSHRLWHLGLRHDGGESPLLAFIVIRRSWGWSLPAAVALILPFLSSTWPSSRQHAEAVPRAAMLPVLLAIFLVVLMWTWVRGTKILFDKTVARPTCRCSNWSACWRRAPRCGSRAWRCS